MVDDEPPAARSAPEPLNGPLPALSKSITDRDVCAPVRTRWVRKGKVQVHSSRGRQVALSLDPKCKLDGPRVNTPLRIALELGALANPPARDPLPPHRVVASSREAPHSDFLPRNGNHRIIVRSKQLKTLLRP